VRRSLPDLLGGAGLVAVTLGAIALRLSRLDTIPLHFDGLHPFYEALRIAHGVELPWRGTGSGFRFGALQAWVALPLVVLGDSLRQVLGLNAALHGLGALPLGLAGRAVGGWTGAMVAAGLYATWPIFIAHAHHGGFTYQAPVAVALAAWLAVLALREQATWRPLVGLTVCLAVATSLHPYALAPAVGALALVPALRAQHSLRRIGQATAAGLLVLAPMAVDNLLLMRMRLERDGAITLVQDAEMAARGSLEVLWDAASQGGAGWPREAVLAVLLAPLVALLLAAVVRPRRPAGPLALWAAASLVAFAGLGEALGYAQPYHLAVVLPLGFLVAAWALGAPLAAARVRWPRLGGALVALAVLGVGAATAAAAKRDLDTVYLRPALSQRHLARVEEVTDHLLADAAGRPRTLALVAESSRVTVGDNIAWHLEQWLRGEPDEAFPVKPGFDLDWPRAYVVVELSPDAWARWPPEGRVLYEVTTRGDTLLRLLVFEDLPEAALWLRRACPLREAGLDLPSSPPRESLGGVRGTTGPHVSLDRWAELCPHPTDDRWLR